MFAPVQEDEGSDRPRSVLSVGQGPAVLLGASPGGQPGLACSAGLPVFCWPGLLASAAAQFQDPAAFCPEALLWIAALRFACLTPAGQSAGAIGMHKLGPIPCPSWH